MIDRDTCPKCGVLIHYYVDTCDVVNGVLFCSRCAMTTLRELLAQANETRLAGQLADAIEGKLSRAEIRMANQTKELGRLNKIVNHREPSSQERRGDELEKKLWEAKKKIADLAVHKILDADDKLIAENTALKAEAAAQLERYNSALDTLALFKASLDSLQLHLREIDSKEVADALERWRTSTY